jgi:hypothetical protein
MRCRLTNERNLSKWQLMFAHSKFLRRLARPLFPSGWTASSFETSGELDAQRQVLDTLDFRLTALGIVGTMCKFILVTASHFARESTSQSIIYLVNVLLVEAFPSLVTLLLLYRFHFCESGSSRGALNQLLMGFEDHTKTDISAAASRIQLSVQNEAGNSNISLFNLYFVSTDTAVSTTSRCRRKFKNALQNRGMRIASCQ